MEVTKENGHFQQNGLFETVGKPFLMEKVGGCDLYGVGCEDF